MKEQGYIKWEYVKILKSKTKNVNIYAHQGENDSPTIVFLPVVPGAEEIVKSFISTVVTEDIVFKLYEAGKYAENGFDIDPNRIKPNANDVAEKLMKFEAEIFDAQVFNVKDNRLFSYRPAAIVIPPSFFVKIKDNFPRLSDFDECVWWMETVSSDGGDTWDDTGYEWQEADCEDIDIWGYGLDPGISFGGGSTGTRTPENECPGWFKLIPNYDGSGFNPSTPPPCEPPLIPTDPIPNPCDQADSLARDQAMINLLDTLQTRANDTGTHKETGYVYLNNNNGSLDIAPVEGEDGKADINVTVYQPIDGYMHNHYTGLLSVFSPSDIWSMCMLYRDSNVVNIMTFNIFVTTATGTEYLLKVEDVVKFKTFGQNLTSSSYKIFEKVYSDWWKINPDNSNEDNERYFLKFLEKTNGGTGLKLFRGNNSFDEWTPLGLDRDGNVMTQPCI